MKGMSGGLSGGLKSDKENTDAETARALNAFKGGIALRDIGQKEKSTNALSALYGARTDATIKGKTSNERWKDAQKLIIDKQKGLYGTINPLMPKAVIEEQHAAADKEMAEFKKQTYGQYGFSPDGQDIAPKTGARPDGPVPSSSRVIGDKEAEDAGLYDKSDMSGSGTYPDPHVLGGSTEDEMRRQFYAIKPGAFFINPKTYNDAIDEGLSPDEATRRATMSKK